jgi:hypothetical protein
VAGGVEARLPVGVRRRQLTVRTLLLGMLLVLADCRPAHLTRVHQALVSLPVSEQWRLGVIAAWPRGPHTLSYRQTERTFGLVVGALEKEVRDGTPSGGLSDLVHALIEASVPASCKGSTTSYAVDWTDIESFSVPPPETGGDCADTEASWGHRRGDGPGQKDEGFFGYYLQFATMVHDMDGPAVPELARGMLLTACRVDPPPAFISVLAHMHEVGVVLGDVLDDSGYAHRVAENWALPLRRLGAQLVQDLHPHDRGTQGTHEGAICWNGNLYCPATPSALFDLGPLGRRATEAETLDHDATSAEMARYKLSPVTADDADGYHRVGCPAVTGKVRCPLRADSMVLGHDRPEILTPPAHPPVCCTQQTLTVPPGVNAKTRQRHDYPSKAHRLSYARRSAAERTNATIKDPATNDVARGWCRVMGTTAMTLFVVCLLVVRNGRVLDAFSARQADDARRLAAGMTPRTRKRRRKTMADLVGAANAPP